MTTLASDTFADTNNVVVSAHVPTSGFTSWADRNGVGTQAWVQSNKLVARAGAYGTQEHILASPGIAADAFDYSADIVPVGTGSRAGLRFRCNSTLGDGSEFFTVYVQPVSETSLTVFCSRMQSGWTAAESMTSVSGINLGSVFTTGYRLGVTAIGSSITIWTEPYGGGTRTTRATWTPSTAWNDTSHKQFGIARAGTGEAGTTWDNVTVTAWSLQSSASSLSLAAYRPWNSEDGLADETTATISTVEGVALPGLALAAGVPRWLTASLDGTTTPTTLRVSGNASGLAPGVHVYRVQVTDASAQNTPLEVPVSFTVYPGASTTRYGATAAGVYDTIAGVGAPVTFTRATPGIYSATADTRTDASTQTVTGVAVRVRGEPSRYRALSLVESEAPTLLFKPTALYAAAPDVGDSVSWAGDTYLVRDVDPVAPDGVLVVARVIVAR